MKLTQSMLLTKEQRRGNAIVVVLFSIIVMFAAQFLVILPTQQKGINVGLAEVMVSFLSVVVIGVILLYAFLVEKRTPPSFGFKKAGSVKKYFLGLAIGSSIILSVFVINALFSAIDVQNNLSQVSWLYLAGSVIGYFFQGMMEEVLCRGLIMNTLSARYNVWTRIIANSVIFSILHAAGFTLATLNLFLAGLLFSLLFYLTDNLFFVSAIHSAWNFILGPVLGVSVSGMRNYSSVLKTNSLPQHSSLNGGIYGFEGGAVLTVVLVVIIAYALYRIKKKFSVA
ncbi:CPBP family intramembrane glutamic endopeptidase [Candidatus Enterococcus clewellii]|uniref:CAAX prenyl protease 2/Lysostaphin resistance protein A-like domain-containing protein n=1 Tax=Candidatus Enterococcus clewellii TaxID=1834193 RepID=A0A242KAZ2_9ENTE|nr:type II CAAX endopeptidase family protein [Enterococcus sp. 9E7_DIV0242]OTP17710.1 hypothetical protein A5888_001848 [Enterococcus sp. 9E7_DIV0242]